MEFKDEADTARVVRTIDGIDKIHKTFLYINKHFFVILKTRPRLIFIPHIRMFSTTIITCLICWESVGLPESSAASSSEPPRGKKDPKRITPLIGASKESRLTGVFGRKELSVQKRTRPTRAARTFFLLSLNDKHE